LGVEFHFKKHCFPIYVCVTIGVASRVVVDEAHQHIEKKRQGPHRKCNF